MACKNSLRVIARVHTVFPSKFGIPRQSGLVDALQATVVFEPKYRDPDALRGLEGFSHIWLLWDFSEVPEGDWSPTVRPPKLGGNRRVGVFATRSPYRPNPIGLSCVRLEKIERQTSQGPVLHITGADLMDGTPIYDIKPYLAYVDAHPDATGGFALRTKAGALKVNCPATLLEKIPENLREGLLAVLAQDPRPAYQNQPERVYGFPFAGFDVRFTVQDETLLVCEIVCI